MSTKPTIPPPKGKFLTTPIYDIDKTYLENAEEGPFFKGDFFERDIPPPHEWGEFLGYPVASRLGVAAGPLLNSRWISFASKMGFDILTYKTIRSREYPALPLPNVVYLDASQTVEKNGQWVNIASRPPLNMSDLAATNSFGMPSRSPSYLIEDIAKANSALLQGQVMIVSIVGTYSTASEMVDDYTKTAQLAKEGGAKILEANFSCPNVSSCEGSLYTSPEAVYSISSAIVKVTGLPLIAKIGAMHDKALLRKVMLALAKAGARGIAGINTVSGTIVDEQGRFPLGEKRKSAGVCGEPIRLAALRFVALAKEIIIEEKLDLKLIATGGVTCPSHFDLFFEEGADIAMSALGMMWDPYLALRYHLKEGE